MLERHRTARGVHPTSALENPVVDVTVSFCPAILPWCSHVNYVKEDAVCIELSAHKLFALVGNDQHGKTKILDPSFSNALRHRPGSLAQDRTAQLVQCAPTHHLTENDFGTIRRLNLKKGPRQRCWKPRFWKTPFGCTCWTLELSSHVVEILWSGTTETKSPQEFLLARVPTVVMDILIDLLLARCQRFPDICFTVATILIVKRRFVRHHLVSLITVWVKLVLLLSLYRKRTSDVQVFQVRPRLCHSGFLWRLACKISQQVHSIFSWESNLVPFEPRW